MHETWRWRFRFSWYWAFYLTPLLSFVALLGASSLFLPKRRGPKMINWSFTVGCTVGFLAWLIAWNLLGEGGGTLHPLIQAIAVVGWVAGSVALYGTTRPDQREVAAAGCLAVLAMWLGAVVLADGGTGIIWLMLLCAGALGVCHGVRALCSRIPNQSHHDPGIIWIENE